MLIKLPAADAVLDLLPDAVCMVDPEGHFVYVNAAFERIFGYRPGEAIGRQMLELVHPADREATLRVVAQIMQGQPSPHFRNRYLHRDGHVVDIQWSARWLPGHGVRLAVGHEVTALRGAERTLEYLASHDPLTGLENRASLWKALEAALAPASDGAAGLAVLYLDLDGFKRINDAHGHAAGDQVLRDVAQCLRACTRQADLVARVGGDEFVVLLAGCGDVASARAVAIKLRESIAALDTPLPLDASIGLARPAEGDTADALLRRADAAMYIRKVAQRAQREAAPGFSG